ncbi:hypothetical protein [Endozoicomonas atrinae]
MVAFTQNYLQARISQEALPLYLGFFEFLHNVGRRGKSLLQPLVNL